MRSDRKGERIVKEERKVDKKERGRGRRKEATKGETKKRNPQFTSTDDIN